MPHLTKRILETTKISTQPATEALRLYQTDTYAGIFTRQLGRQVKVEVFRPDVLNPQRIHPLLVLNDGQDSEAVHVRATVERLVQEKVIQPVIVAGVVAGDRLQEYGVSARADYQGRGRQARAYSRYIVQELVPYLLYQYPINPAPEAHAIAGYSMGGLSAVDIAFQFPEIFHKVGAFSGSFWWRKRDTASRFYSDYRDRLMHLQVRKGKFKPGLRFWFQTGTEDEKSDRNKNGIIDSIDDTLDLIVDLTQKGYRPFHDIQYLEIPGGQHNAHTWRQAFPTFLKWAFPAG